MESIMKYAAILAVVAATSAFAVGPASASKMEPCSGENLTKMTTMTSGMPDGPQKWEMYKHLQMVNAAMAKDGMRGCDTTSRKMMRGSKAKMMKSGKMVKSGM